MARILGVDIETPQEAQQRILQERLVANRQNQNPYASIGNSFADMLMSATGGGYGAQKRAIDARQGALAAGEAAKLAALDKGSDPFDAESLARATAAARIRSLGGPENIAIANQLTEMNATLMRERDAEKQKMATLKAQEESAKASTELSQRKHFESLDLSDLETEQEMNAARLSDPDFRQKSPKAYEKLVERQSLISRRAAELEEEKRVLERELTVRERYSYNYLEAPTEDGQIATIAINRSNPNDRTVIHTHRAQPTAQDRKEAQKNREAFAQLNPIVTVAGQMADLDASKDEDWGGRGGSMSPGEDARDYRSMSDELSVVIKPLVKQPGEGAFTDKDQERLDSVVPQITDTRKIRVRKMKNLRDLVAVRGATIYGEEVTLDYLAELDKKIANLEKGGQKASAPNVIVGEPIPVE